MSSILPRSAIIVANQDFRPDANLGSLRGPLNDAANLARILSRADIGNFNTTTFVNSTSAHVKTSIEEKLGVAGPDDLVFIYYSGHGRLDRFGNLCLATADTKATALQTTSIPAAHLRSLAANSNCGTVLLVFDCCYSGAATESTRGDVESQLTLLAQGSGFFILSASSEIQTSSEAEVDGVVLGKFTATILEGIQTGRADYDKDGYISLNDLFRYAKSNLTNQSPRLFVSSGGGDPIICRTPVAKEHGRAAANASENTKLAHPKEVKSDHRTFKLRVFHRIAHPARVVDVAFNRDDSTVATVCDDGEVRIFDLPSFEQTGKLRYHPHSLRSASWSRGGSEIATSDSTGRLSLWRDGVVVGEMASGSRGLCCAQYSPNGMALVAGSEDGMVSLWKPQQRKLLWRKKLHDGIVSSVRFHPDGKSIVTASYDGQAAVLDANTGVEISRFTRHSDQLTAAFFVSSNREPAESCVSAGLDGEVCIWPIHDGDSAYIATRHSFWVTALAYCNKAQLIISGGYDAAIRIIDLSTGHVFEGGELDQGPVVCVRSSQEENILAITTHDGIAYFLSLSC